MIPRNVQPLAYESPTRERNADAAGSEPWLVTALLVIAAPLAVTVVRTNPGGPFVSIHGDVVPSILCLLVLVLASRSYPKSSPGRRAGLIVAMVVACGIICLSVFGIVSFVNLPRARGALFGL